MDAVSEIEQVAPATTVGGYAQLQARWLGVGPEPEYEGEATVRRLVLMLSHDLSGLGLPIRFTTELEWENAIAGDGWPGSTEVEQAVLEARLLGDDVVLRGGLLLVPFGILNEDHDPPAFHGVDRPSLEQILIPTTWRELGLGLSGAPGPLRYQITAMTSLDPTGFDDAGIVNGRTLGANAPANALALAGRVELDPTPGLVLGLSGYGSDTGPAADWYSAAGERLDLFIPVLGGEFDARWSGWGVEARALGVIFALPESDDLMEAYKADGSPYFLEGSAPVPSRMAGGYVEVAFNVLFFSESAVELLPFARLERYDTQAAVPEGWEPNPLRTVDEGTFGLTLRPVRPVAIKADVQLRDRRYGDDELQFNAGLGLVY